MRRARKTVVRALVRALPLALWLSACNDGPKDVGLPNEDVPNQEPRPFDSEQPSPVEVPAEETPPEPANSQTGSPGGVECYEDLDCFGGSRERTIGPMGHVELLGAACVHPWVGQELPMCECRMRMTPSGEADAGAAEPHEVQLYPGNRPGGCSEWTRAPGCLYCEREFPGCSIDDAASCDAVCSDMAQRYESELQKTITAKARLARCAPDGNYCQVVTEIDGVCHAGPPGVVEPALLDCSLSDEELLQRLDDPAVPSCQARPAVPCATGSDCPRGLGCNAGVCGHCSGTCFYPEGRPDEAICEGDSACAEGELCTLGMCLPRDNIDCRFFTECPADNSCVLSGFGTTGRGNAETRSFCQPNF